MDSISFPNYWREASDELAAGDPVMAGFVELYSGDSLVSRGDSFGTLVRSIVGQQISVKAADSIWARFSSTLVRATSSGIHIVCSRMSRSAALRRVVADTYTRPWGSTVTATGSGTFKSPGGPARFHGVDDGPKGPGPKLGEHTHEILRSIGYADADIEAMYAGKSVA